MRHTYMQLFIIMFILLVFAVYTGLLLYYRATWKSIPHYQAPVIPQRVSISVIIPARNEEAKLPKLLQGLAKQSYDQHLFEVIIVDDHSTDRTADIVKQFSSGNIKLVQLKDHVQGPGINSYKKKAIEVAIGQSTGELIVTTDADCIVPVNWLQNIAAFYQEKDPAFIVMPVCYNYQHNLLEIFQALDFMTLQGITGASVYKNVHSMCNGANLAYTRKAFDAVEGFKGINNIASGDDMLLMHKIYKRYPQGIQYIRSKEVIVQTEAMHSLKDFFNQRIRWASKADKYDDKRIFWVLLMVYSFNLLLLVTPFLTLFYNPLLSIFSCQFSLFVYWLFLITGKTAIELFFLYPVALFFGKQSLLWLFPLAEPFHILYTVIAGWLGKFGSYQWKERKVK